MSALGFILLGLLGFVLALVLVPFRLAASATVHDATPDASLRVEWAWGLVGVLLTPQGAALQLLRVRVWRFSAGTRAKEEKQEPEADDDEPRGSWLQSLRNGLRDRKVLVSMVMRLARTLRLRLQIRGVIGLGDPADTAVVFAALRALAAVPGVQLEVATDWLEEELEVDAAGSARVWIIHLLVVAAGLLLVRENRVALRAVRTGS